MIELPTFCTNYAIFLLALNFASNEVHPVYLVKRYIFTSS